MRVERPWGWYEELTEGPAYKVKRLLVRAGCQLSLQRHRYRVKAGPWWMGRVICCAASNGIKPVRG